jgi:vacuolar-type H+-ATPase subunit D/Vma8
MAALDRVIEGVKEVLRMSDEVKRLAESMKDLAAEVREMDRRLVKIETIAELAATRSPGRSTKRLPRSEG